MTSPTDSSQPLFKTDSHLSIPPLFSTIPELSDFINYEEISNIKTVKTPEELHRIEDFREKIFRPLYPDLNKAHNDPHDQHAIVYYSENAQGDILCTARMVFDSPEGLPSDNYAKYWIDQLRQNDLNIAEVSRFAIAPEARKLGMLMPYYRKFYLEALKYGIDSLIIAIDRKSVGFHKKRIGAKLLLDGIDRIAGSQFEFACMEWKIDETKESFLKWIGEKPPKSGTETLPQLFSPYSTSFASIMAQPQREMYHATLPYLSGSVVDLGAGPCRLAPLLADKPEVLQYTAVECAAEMVEIARFTLNKLRKPHFRVLHQQIEEVVGQFDSAVSLQSFYAWDDPQETLHYIYEILVPGSVFVLATPNLQFDQKKLLDEAEKELMWHPDFEAFKAYNQQLAIHPETTFISMNDLIHMLLKAGFHIEHCHTHYFDGGVNFVVARKPD